MQSRLAPVKKTLGASRRGAPIDLYLFCPPDAGNTLDTLFIGAFHGDEGIAAELMTRFLSHLEHETLPADIQSKAFAVLPVLNPDGLGDNTRVNAAGVDLNRNFPTRDWVEDNRDTIYYSGPAPASEPETRLLIELLEARQPGKIISVHAPYRVINYDGPGRPLAEAMARHNGYEVVESIGYPTPGSFGTYLGVERNRPVITLELPEDEPLETVWRDNRDALLAAIAFPIG